MRSIMSFFSVVVIAVFFFGSSAIYIVDQRQQAILFQLGEVIDVKTEPGLYFKIPLAQNVRYFDKRILTMNTEEPERFITSEKKNVLVDLAHASPKVIDDVLKTASRPVIVSHTGVKGTCNNARNLSDEQLKGIAVAGGVVGIGFWETATCGRDAAAIAKAIRYTVDLIGIDHVALGSDFDGAIDAPFDTTGMVLITDALLQAGFNEAEIRKIMGENIIRTLQFFLP